MLLILRRLHTAWSTWPMPLLAASAGTLDRPNKWLTLSRGSIAQNSGQDRAIWCTICIKGDRALPLIKILAVASASTCIVMSAPGRKPSKSVLTSGHDWRQSVWRLAPSHTIGSRQNAPAQSHSPERRKLHVIVCALRAEKCDCAVVAWLTEPGAAQSGVGFVQNKFGPEQVVKNNSNPAR